MESEALWYFLDEAKDTQQDECHIEEDSHELNEEEEAHDFLQQVGLADLSKLCQQGEEITEKLINESVRLCNLNAKQTETVRSRVRTLNSSLQSRHPKRKHRLDIRNISWNVVDTNSTGTRSRSCTPDSLDSIDVLHEDLTSDEDQQLTSLPAFPLEHSEYKLKTKVIQPIPGKKIGRTDRADVAHLGSENVVLKAYQPLSENELLPNFKQRERSGSDPTADVHLNLSKDNNLPIETPRFENKSSRTALTRSNTDAVSTLSRKTNGESDGSSEKVQEKVDKLPQKENLSFERFCLQNKVEEINKCSDLTTNDQLISIDELSDSEYQYLKPLLYLEVVALFDQYNIKFLKRKTSAKKGGNVFGVNLSTLIMRDRHTDNTLVPQIFKCIINEINIRCVTESGILRVAAQKQKLDLLCNEIEKKFFTNRQSVENCIKQASVHELCGVLKKLLRDLPDPMFTMELFDMFYKISRVQETEDRVKALNLLILMLPVENRNTFRMVLQLLSNIVAHAEDNRMDLHNVAMITAPSLFPPRLLLIGNVSKDQLSNQISDAAVCCLIVELMLTYGDRLWMVPKGLAMQAKESQERAHYRKYVARDNRIQSGKTKLARSRTQYVPGVMNTPRLKPDFII